MHNPGRIKTFTANGAIAAKRIVSIAANNIVSQAASASDANIGATELSCADGAPIDVVMEGIVEVEAGGSITAGTYVTADSAGKAVTAEVTDPVFGKAMDSVSAGEYAPVRISFGRAGTAAASGG